MGKYKKKQIEVKCHKCGNTFLSEHTKNELGINYPKGKHGGRFVNKEVIYELCQDCILKESLLALESRIGV